MKRRHLLWVIGIVLIVAAGIAGVFYWRGQEPAPKEESITIGAVLPLSGPVSLYGQSERRGMRLAVNDVNEEGGIRGKTLKVQFEDSRGEAKTGASATRKLLNSNVKIIATSLTEVSESAKPLIAKEGGTQIIYAMDETLPRGTDSAFRIYPGIREEGKTFLRYAKFSSPERAAIVHFEQTAINGQVNDVLRPGLRELGIDVVAVESFGSLEGNVLRAIAAKVKSREPDQIYVNAYYNQLPTVLKIMSEYGLVGGDVKLISGLNLSVAIRQGNIPSEMLNNTVVAAPTYSIYSRDTTDAAKRRKVFTRKYKSKYGQVPNFDAAYAYDAVRILAVALRRAKKKSSTLNQELKNIKKYRGISAKINITESGNAETSWAIGVYQNGVLEPLERKPSSIRE